MLPDGPAAVLVPLKAFDRAKARLAGTLEPTERERLARSMAQQVLDAAAPLPVFVVCDDAAVADWAALRSATVVRSEGLDLNQSVQHGLSVCRDRGYARVVAAHGDLPFARQLALLAEADPDEVLVVPDRRGSGTNVLSVPTAAGFRVAYGEGSCRRHLEEAARCGLRASLRPSEHLGWDVDEPEDLQTPDSLGRIAGCAP